MKKALLIIGGLILLIVLGGFLISPDVHVERSIVVNAPAEKVFDQVNSFPNWAAWSPWAKMDPNMKHEYTGPESGVGHKDTWTSEEKNVGSGSQEIVTSVPGELMESELDFGENGTGKGFFKFETEGEGTKVTWGMEADMGNNPIARYMGLMMDKMMGPVFDQGLNDLKAHVESLPDPEPEMEAMPMEGKGAASDSTAVEETPES